MMEVLIFLLKAVIVVISLGALLVLIVILSERKKQSSKVKIESINEKLEDYELQLKSRVLSDSAFKSELKARKARQKAIEKNVKSEPQPTTYVLTFDGDVKASGVEHLREEITALLQVASPKDQVVVKIKSPGGVVHGYGLAASQLHRIKAAQIPLVACVDEVAASGGYMMASVCDKILAAPFAIVGSIGVVAQVPNVHKLLKKYDIDYKEYTAGEVKRTVSLFGEITPKGEAHFLQKLADVHVLFKNHVSKYRPQVDLTKVADGDHWFGQEALELKLVDELRTSDDYLQSLAKENRSLYAISIEEKTGLMKKLPQLVGGLFSEVSDKLESKSLRNPTSPQNWYSH